jgi:pyruvate ferredoxin oxidoreductase beta subunit
MGAATEKLPLVSHGLTTCEGCVMELIGRVTLDVLGPKTIMLTPPSCSAILTGYGQETGWRVPAFQSNLENIAAYCSGIRTALEVQGKDDVHVVAFAGDGGTVDIGLQALSGAVERGHRFIYICYDNEAYMNTGIQRSGATPLGAWTTTTPAGKKENKKDIVAMLRSQGIPYLATASAGYIDDFRRKVKKAKDVDGPVYIHVLTPCAAGWRFPPKETVNIARLAVDTGLWPLYEVVDGRLKVTKKTKELNPVTDYIKRQGRFRNISADQIAQLEKVARQLYQELLAQEAKA